MKNKTTVEARIVATALKMFNDTGIEYVGMRELAARLQMRIGNLTYYSPTKDDLVYRLALALTEENSQAIVPTEQLSMESFFQMLEQVFRNHIKYRCLLLSFVHIMKRNPLIAKNYSQVQAERQSTWMAHIRTLHDAQYITATPEEIHFLVSSISLISRFWISEAAVSFRKETEAEQMHHYIKMVARILLPYATKKGKPVLNGYLT